MKSKHAIRIAASFALATLLSGCAFGVSRVSVGHSALDAVAQRSGTVVVREFTDNRKDDHRYIGTKRNGYGMPLGHIGVGENKRLEEVVTEGFVDALRHAGYNAVLEKSSASAKGGPVLTGEITKFWLDLYMATWHEIGVNLTLVDRQGNRVLWQREIKGNKTNVLWLGLNSEFENVIREAMNKALSQAAKEFAGDEFYRKVSAGH